MTAQGAAPPRSIGLRLGVIADDATGGADLAGMLTSQGVRTLLCLDVTAVPPDAVADDSRWDAVTLALKIRSVLAAEAVSRALLALRSLQALGARRLFFKYCSTFDSTSEGNIGPVLDALMHATAVRSCCLVPALPVNGRTQYFGHLFVEGRLLSESPLRDHPLNPMRDPDLVRHLQAQTRRRVGLLSLAAVRAGAQALRAARARLEQQGIALALVDAIDDGDLRTIAEALAEDRLVSGGSGLALALPGAWRERDGGGPGVARSSREHDAAGPTLILNGSCSERTREQIACLEEFLRVYDERFAKQHGPLRPVVERVLRAFLTCGLVEHGFARLWCGTCRTSVLCPFSCRGRNFCPSCEKKKQLLWAEWLTRPPR